MARMVHRFAFLLSALALFSGAARAQGLEGTWLTTNGKAFVEVKPCGQQLCGQIVWLRNPKDASGRPLRDGYNEDATQRARPIMGLPILLGLQAIAASQWQGQIYDPERGKTFDVQLSHAAADRLEITGCGLMGLVCETHVWTRRDWPSAEQAAQ